jgi:teichoic acid transport system permease protein
MATIGAATPDTAPSRSSYVRELWARREFIVHLARGNLAAKTAEARLGVLWWVLNPLLLSAIYFVVFGLIIRGTNRSSASFLAYLIVGVLVFRFFTVTLSQSAGLIISNAKLIVNLRFPRLVLPIAAVLEGLITFLASLSVFYLLVTPVSCIQAARDVVGVTCIAPTYRLALLPIPLLLLVMFTLGIGAFVARWAVPIRDVRNVIPHVTRFWFYLSPVLWGTERLASVADDWPLLVYVLEANPMYAFLSLFRTALINDPFEPLLLASGTAWAVIVMLLGVRGFVRHEDEMARYL